MENKDYEDICKTLDFFKGETEQEKIYIYKSLENIINKIVNTLVNTITSLKSKEKNKNLLNTDFCSLTFHKGDLIVLSSRPYGGKTSFALSLINHLALNKKVPVAYISLGSVEEISFGMRLIGINSRVSIAKIRAAMLKESDIKKIQEALGKLYDAPIYFINEPNSTFETLKWKVKLLVQEKHVQLIVINDYEMFEELVDSEPEYYRYNLEVLLENLKKLAIEEQISVILEIGLTPSETDSPPCLRDFKKYMIIPYLADMVIIIQRERLKEEVKKQEAELHIVKNEHDCRIGYKSITFEPIIGAFCKDCNDY